MLSFISNGLGVVVPPPKHASILFSRSSPVLQRNISFFQKLSPIFTVLVEGWVLSGSLFLFAASSCGLCLLAWTLVLAPFASFSLPFFGCCLFLKSLAGFHHLSHLKNLPSFWKSSSNLIFTMRNAFQPRRFRNKGPLDGLPYTKWLFAEDIMDQVFQKRGELGLQNNQTFLYKRGELLENETFAPILQRNNLFCKTFPYWKTLFVFERALPNLSNG